MSVWWYVVILLVSVSVSGQAADTLRVPAWGVGGNVQNHYFVDVLQLALDKTVSTDGELSIEVGPRSDSSARDMMYLKQGQKIDVLWFGTSPELEANFLAVKISLLKDLNRYRVLMIRQDDRARFEAINSVDDLRRLTGGSGANWPSTAMLKRNDLPVITVINTQLLSGMLKAKRIDYMARNLSEAWDESLLYKDDGFVLENRLLLDGGVDFYFFFNKSNIRLANRIERGIKIAQADGSFDRLFEAVPGFKHGQQLLQDPKRIKLSLK